MSSIPPTVPPPPGGGSYTPPPSPPPGGAPGASSDRTIMLVLSYLGLLALVPLLMKKDDREVQWHAKNGLAIFGAWVVLCIVYFIIQTFLPSVVSCGTSLIGCVLSIGYIVVIILAIVKATSGQRFRLPVISDMADKW